MSRIITVVIYLVWLSIIESPRTKSTAIYTTKTKICKCSHLMIFLKLNSLPCEGNKNHKLTSHQVQCACRNPGLNQGPLDLQSNALPTELFRLVKTNPNVPHRTAVYLREASEFRLSIFHSFYQSYIKIHSDCSLGAWTYALLEPRIPLITLYAVSME